MHLNFSLLRKNKLEFEISKFIFLLLFFDSHHESGSGGGGLADGRKLFSGSGINSWLSAGGN